MKFIAATTILCSATALVFDGAAAASHAADKTELQNLRSPAKRNLVSYETTFCYQDKEGARADGHWLNEYCGDFPGVQRPRCSFSDDVETKWTKDNVCECASADQAGCSLHNGLDNSEFKSAHCAKAVVWQKKDGTLTKFCEQYVMHKEWKSNGQIGKAGETCKVSLGVVLLV